MSIQFQFRRGTASEHSTFTGAEGEITVDLTGHVVVVHDGSTAGGFKMARQDEIPTAMSELTNDAGYLTSVEAETVTSLSINGNVLTYTDENGTNTDIDLTTYLDDTNLARLTTGTLNPATGIATFTRDDASTFTVDFSALIDQNVTLTGSGATTIIGTYPNFTISSTDTTYTNATTSSDGLMSIADKVKLNSIETGATGDMTAAEIKAAYESNTQTNSFTDAEKTKLAEIETGANNYVHPSLQHIPAGGSTDQILSWSSAGTAQWITPTAAASAINDLTDVDTTGAVNGSILKFNGTNWIVGVDDSGEAGTITLTDLSVTQSAASGNGTLSYNNTNGVFTYTPPDLSGYLTSFTETDPVFTAWDKSTGISITESQISDFGTYLTSYTETDPVFSASAAASIASGNITNWNTAFGWGDHSTAGYLTSETTTSLSINANVLTYTDETGTDTDIDLSLYIDDTNLARLTSGTLNGTTGIATFTRDDASTFTVDFSALLDDVTVSLTQGGATTITGTYPNFTISSTDTIYDDSAVLKDADALTAVTVGNKLITQSDIVGLGGGDMVKSTYDTNDNGKVDSAENADTVNNLTVQTAVPAGAVFTDTTYTNVSEFTNDAGYLTSETTTSLAINANILTYTDETGTDTDIDLSLYIDDTNLARLTSGTLNGTTGIATFTRDDASTFTVDFSALLDDVTVSLTQGGATTITGTYPNFTISSTDTTYSNATTSVAGLMSAGDKTKLDGIEANATGDMSASEIKTAYESNADTNAFTDAEKSKLGTLQNASITIEVDEQTATASQTVITIGGGKTYTPGTNEVEVFINGVRLGSADYTETNSTTVTLGTGLTLGDEILIKVTKLFAATATTTVSSSAPSGGSDGDVWYLI